MKTERNITLVLLASMIAFFAAGYYFGLKTGYVNGYHNGLNNYAGTEICVDGKIESSMETCEAKKP